jgi:hypothetical protein
MVGAWLKANVAAVILLVIAAGAGVAAVAVPSDDDDGGGGGGDGDAAFCDTADEVFGGGFTLEALDTAVTNGQMDDLLSEAPDSEIRDDLSVLTQAIVEQNVDAATAEAAANDLVAALDSECGLDLATTTTSSSPSTTSSPTTSGTTSATTSPTTSPTTTTTTTTTTTSAPPPT